MDLVLYKNTQLPGFKDDRLVNDLLTMFGTVRDAQNLRAPFSF
jgi:hypothetical protein